MFDLVLADILAAFRNGNNSTESGNNCISEDTWSQSEQPLRIGEVGSNVDQPYLAT